jgi:hypothetical protein
MKLLLTACVVEKNKQAAMWNNARRERERGSDELEREAGILVR